MHYSSICSLNLTVLRSPIATNWSSSNQKHPRRQIAVRASRFSERQLVETTPAVGRRMALAGIAFLGQASLRPQQQTDARATYVDERLAQAVFDSSTQSVVSLSDFQVIGGEEKLEGVGSGIVWDKLGHVITNYHCIARLVNDKAGTQSARVAVIRQDGSSVEYSAKVVGFDRTQDLAVLKIDAPAEVLSPVKVGTSSDLRVGQSVYAIGNPSGLSHTLTVGSVSGLGRSIPSATGDRIFGAIQTDAAISAGNSGGPLLDSFGRMVGVNTATFTRQGSGKSSGVNFAVPVDTVMKLVPNIIVKNEA